MRYSSGVGNSLNHRPTSTRASNRGAQMCSLEAIEALDDSKTDCLLEPSISLKSEDYLHCSRMGYSESGGLECYHVKRGISLFSSPSGLVSLSGSEGGQPVGR